MKNDMAIFTASIALLISGLEVFAGYANYPVPNYWATNGTVRDLKTYGTSLFIAGDFTYVGLMTGGGAALASDTALVNSSFPSVHGTVHCVISDADGGFYIGGDFSTVGYKGRSNIAHILSGGAVDHNFNIAANGIVRAIALSPDGKTLYLGGDFTTVASVARKRLASASIDTNTLTDWAPSSNNSVKTLALSPDGSIVYAGGTFTNINSSTRNRIAAMKSSDGSLLPDWNPNANNYVNSIKLSPDGSILYVGGHFTSIAGETRKYLAAISGDGTLSTFDPSPNSTVGQLAISADGTILYLSGLFTTISGVSRKHMAALRVSDGGATAWSPASVNAQIDAFALSGDGNTIYICGQFTAITSVSRRYIAALESSDGTLASWNSSLENFAGTLAVSSDGSKVYVGGTFVAAGGATRNRVAAINTATDTLTDWNPNANGTVFRLEFSHDKSIIYAGGAFTQIGEAKRNYIAALGTLSGTANAWNPNANASVRSLRISPDGIVLYAGGGFTQIGGAARKYLASLGPGTGNAGTWNPSPDNTVYALQVSPDGKTIYAGGNFKNVGTLAQNYLAAIDSSNGTAKGWTSPANGIVYDLKLSQNGNLLFAGGAFTSCCGRTRSRIASVLTSTGTASTWNPGANGTLYGLMLSSDGQYLYSGGVFTFIGGSQRYYAGAVSTSTDAKATSWNPTLNNSCLAFALSGDEGKLFAAGSFTKAANQFCQYLAAFQKNEYHLKVENGSGDGNYSQGTIVDINADIPPEGQYFYKWTGSTSYVADVNSAYTKVTMPASDITVTATYKSYTYAVTFTPGANGTLTGKTTQTITHGASTSSVKAVPDSDYRFENWTGEGFESDVNPIIIKDVTGGMDITANFEPASETAELAVSPNPVGGGSTSPSGTSQVMTDRPFIISATASAGYHFLNWTGSENISITSPNESTTTAIISAAAALDANFAATPENALLAFKVSPDGSGQTVPSGTVSQPTASSFNITATPNDGYYFLEWSVDSGCVLIQNYIQSSTTATAYGDATITANLAEIPPDTFVTYGKIYNLLAADVPKIANFAKVPQVFCQYIVDPDIGKTAKTMLKILTKAGKTAVDDVDCEWTGKIALLNRKIWTQDKTATTEMILQDNEPYPLDCALYASAVDSSGVKVKNELTEIVLSERTPVISSVCDENGKTISAAGATQEIIIRGSFWGKTVPSAWLEYKDKNGNVKKLNLKVDKKSLKFSDYAGKEGKSCMNIYTGESEITAYMPAKWPNGWSHVGEHDIVIDNKICRATISFGTIGVVK